MIKIFGMIFFWLLPLVNIQPRALASKKDKQCGEDSLISSSSSSSSSPGQVQHTQPDSTVRDPEWVEGEKRKIFSCEYEGCNKKYTKLSHLKVRGSEFCNYLKSTLRIGSNQGIIYALNGNLLSGFIKQNNFIIYKYVSPVHWHAWTGARIMLLKWTFLKSRVIQLGYMTPCIRTLFLHLKTFKQYNVIIILWKWSYRPQNLCLKKTCFSSDLKFDNQITQT